MTVVCDGATRAVPRPAVLEANVVAAPQTLNQNVCGGDAKFVPPPAILEANIVAAPQTFNQAEYRCHFLILVNG